MPGSRIPQRHPPSDDRPTGRIQLGVIGRAHGVRGLVNITSYTADPADLTTYGTLSDDMGHSYVVRWKAEGVAEVSLIVDGLPVKVTDRSQAEKLTNTKLFVDRSALPPPDDEEYYLIDLVGLAVVDQACSAIGTVAVVHDYGAGASLEIQREAGPTLIVPFTAACVPTVDIAGGRLVVVEPAEVVVAPDAATAVATGIDKVVPCGTGPNVSTDAVQAVASGTGYVEAAPCLAEDKAA